VAAILRLESPGAEYEPVTVASGGGERGRRGGDLILSFALPN